MIIKNIQKLPEAPERKRDDACSKKMVIVIGYGHGDTSSIPGQDWLHFTYH